MLASEVGARIQVTLNQLLRLEGGVLALVTTFDLLTEDEGQPGCAVVRPRVDVVVLAEVCREGLEALGHVFPQASMTRVLSGVGVEASVITVENPAAEIGEGGPREGFVPFKILSTQ